MRKAFLSIILPCLFFISCSKERQEVPVVPESLKTIMETSDCVCDGYINLYTWKNQSVYVLGYKGPACDWRPVYFDQNGEEMEMENGYSYTDFLQESKLIKNIWSCK